LIQLANKLLSATPCKISQLVNKIRSFGKYFLICIVKESLNWLKSDGKLLSKKMFLQKKLGRKAACRKFGRVLRALCDKGKFHTGPFFPPIGCAIILQGKETYCLFACYVAICISCVEL
jgi:hypothetical protein